MVSFAQYERRLIGQRTREGLQVKRSQGVRLGRPVKLGADVVDRIRTARASGASLRAIAEQLNAAGTPTAHGGAKWHGSTVAKVLSAA
jgi:DNA invertase Pin-like site-specific DNA recombinase